MDRFQSLPTTSEAVETFWMSWEDRIVRLGRGDQVGENEFMSTNEASPLDINFVFVASQGGPTKWTFQVPGMLNYVLPLRLSPLYFQSLQTHVYACKCVYFV